MAALPSFSVNKETLAFAAGIVGLLTVGWNAVSYFKSLEPANNPIIQEIRVKNEKQDLRLDRTDEDRAITKELSVKTEELTQAVVKLTAVIETAGSVTKKVQYDLPAPSGSPTRQSINYEVR